MKWDNQTSENNIISKSLKTLSYHTDISMFARPSEISRWVLDLLGLMYAEFYSYLILKSTKYSCTDQGCVSQMLLQQVMVCSTSHCVYILQVVMWTINIQ